MTDGGSLVGRQPNAAYAVSSMQETIPFGDGPVMV